MHTTKDLLAQALTQHPVSYWHKRLNLNKNTLYVAKARGQLSPAIASQIAIELGENWEKWTIIAAAEGEKDSACRDALIRQVQARTWSGLHTLNNPTKHWHNLTTRLTCDKALCRRWMNAKRTRHVWIRDALTAVHSPHLLNNVLRR